MKPTLLTFLLLGALAGCGVKGLPQRPSEVGLEREDRTLLAPRPRTDAQTAAQTVAQTVATPATVRPVTAERDARTVTPRPEPAVPERRFILDALL